MKKFESKVVFVCLIGVFIVMLISLSLMILRNIKSLTDKPNEESRLIKMEMISQLYYSVTDDGIVIDHPNVQAYLRENELMNIPILIIKYSNFSCSNCMEYLLEKLEKFFPNYSSNSRILFVASDFKADPMRKYGNTIILNYGEDFGMGQEDLNIPFMFILSNGFSFNTFTPDSALDELCETYMSSVKEKYEL